MAPLMIAIRNSNVQYISPPPPPLGVEALFPRIFVSTCVRHTGFFWQFGKKIGVHSENLGVARKCFDSSLVFGTRGCFSGASLRAASLCCAVDQIFVRWTLRLLLLVLADANLNARARNQYRLIGSSRGVEARLSLASVYYSIILMFSLSDHIPAQTYKTLLFFGVTLICVTLRCQPQGECDPCCSCHPGTCLATRWTPWQETRRCPAQTFKQRYIILQG
jgi:hypothetical protein